MKNWRRKVGASSSILNVVVHHKFAHGTQIKDSVEFEDPDEFNDRKTK